MRRRWLRRDQASGPNSTALAVTGLELRSLGIPCPVKAEYGLG